MKSNKEIKSAILMLDQTFGSLRLVVDSDYSNLVGIDLLPTTVEVLGQFKESGVRVIILLTESLPSEALCNLKQFLPSVDEVMLSEKDLRKTLSDCSKHLSTAPEQTLFVSADRVLRGLVASQGYHAVPHPAIAALVVRGCSLQFVRVTGDREHFERIPEMVPYFTEYLEGGARCFLGVMSRAAISEAIVRRLRVDVLSLDLSTEDPLFIQLDDVDKQATDELTKRKVLFADDQRVLVAIGSSEFNDSITLHGVHGHLQFLMPTPELLRPAPDPSVDFGRIQLDLSRWPLKKIKITQIPLDRGILNLIPTLRPMTATSFQADVDRYAGFSNLDSSGPVVSRHIQHPDNPRVVQALLDELNAMGYCTYTHRFDFAGMTLKNVIADLPGIGYFELDPDIVELLRNLFLRHPFPDPLKAWVKDVIRLVGNEWFEEQQLDQLRPSQLRNLIETIFRLRYWFPWWLKRCPLPGLGAKLVIVGCHLDSSASRDIGYNPSTDPAPGADDDSSGIAATLAIARYLSNFRGKLTHTVRFCFFNAEESGLVGSKTYATMLKAAGAPIKAVVCTDMIGYDSDIARIFEIHAGYTDPAVRDASVPIADLIAMRAAHLGSLAPAQIYKGTNSVGGTDRALYDPAINRSDHAAFHQQGYPAVVVSEDYFVNLPSEPGADPNPNYHTANDTVIDSSYSADITCAIANAIKKLAGG
jgi:hypothetical protein